MERDDSERQYIVNMLHFNSHAHVERDVAENSYIHMEEHFNSHAHVERDFLMVKNGIQKRISTHTLTWSVTLLTLCNAKKI